MTDGRLQTLDLFSGIGGIALALRPYARTVAYCEADPWCRSLLLSRMAGRDLDFAPVHHDVRRLDLAGLRSMGIPDIGLVTAGFPCQDLSLAGMGRGLEGERSGLFFEIARLAGDLAPRFIFLENVAALTNRGLNRVLGTLVGLGYDCRWVVQAAAEVGAPHIRRRWWLLAHANRAGACALAIQSGGVGAGRPGQAVWPQTGASRGDGRVAADPHDQRSLATPARGAGSGLARRPRHEVMADAGSQRREERHATTLAAGPGQYPWVADSRGAVWYAEPAVGRVVDGVPQVVDRLRGLGNAVVPQAAERAFRYLMGLDV